MNIDRDTARDKPEQGQGIVYMFKCHAFLASFISIKLIFRKNLA